MTRFWTPARVASLTFLIAILLIRPWGDFPLNDDWQYAWITREWARGGSFAVDLPIAPSLVVQSWLALGVIKLWGFSHLHLRLLTLVLGFALIGVIDAILRLAQVNARNRTLGLLLLVLN